MAFKVAARTAVRSGIMKSLTSKTSVKKIPGKAAAIKSFRTPSGVLTNEVNPLKRLSKSDDAIPTMVKNPAKFFG